MGVFIPHPKYSAIFMLPEGEKCVITPLRVVSRSEARCFEWNSISLAKNPPRRSCALSTQRRACRWGSALSVSRRCTTSRLQRARTRSLARCLIAAGVQSVWTYAICRLQAGWVRKMRAHLSHPGSYFEAAFRAIARNAAR